MRDTFDDSGQGRIVNYFKRFCLSKEKFGMSETIKICHYSSLTPFPTNEKQLVFYEQLEGYQL